MRGTQRPVERTTILGCPVDRITLPDTLEWMAARVVEQTPVRMVVVNANKLYQMAHLPTLDHLVKSSALIIPEWSMCWAADRLRQPSLHHSGGLLIAREFLPFAAARGLRPFFLGATPEVAARMAARVARDFPTLRLAGVHHGYLKDPDMLRSALRMIRDSAPDVLFVAMGSPAQELWIAEHQESLGIPVAIGIGGTVDVLSGSKPDTPAWARGNGLEWIYRTAQDPRAYLGRYVTTNAWFVSQVIRQRVLSYVR